MTTNFLLGNTKRRINGENLWKEWRVMFINGGWENTIGMHFREF
jgi:hypothetical protein